MALELLCPFSRWTIFFCHTSSMMAEFVLRYENNVSVGNVHVKSGHLSEGEEKILRGDALWQMTCSDIFTDLGL